MANSRLTSILSFTLAAVIYFTLSANARAGFLSASVETISSQNPLGLPDVEQAPAESGPLETPVPLKYKHPRAQSAPASGMSAPTTITNPSSGGAAFAMLPTPPLGIPTLLTSRLGPEGRVWLPPAFSTGIFRPPRLCG